MEETMRGVVFTGDREIELMDFPDPTPGPDEVVVEMKASGMCGSDLHQYRRPKSGGEAIGGLPVNPNPVIGGHEPCGVVAAVGSGVSGKMARVGQRVMVHHYKGCTVCEHCRSGWSQLCQEEPVVVYGNNAHGVSPERLSRAKEFGAWETVNPRSNDPVGAIKDLTHGGADFTLDTSSQPEGRIAAVRSAKVWGTVCFVGERNNVTIDVSPDMLRKQLTIIASWTFSWQGQADCARFVAERKVDVEKLFTHRWQLDQAEEAYRLFDTQTTGKGVFLM